MSKIDQAQAQRLEEEYDPEMQMRSMEAPATWIVSALLAATVPAMMHYLGIFTMVHLEAKRLGLRGLRPDEMPRFLKVLREGWAALIPLILLDVVTGLPHRRNVWV